MRMIDVSTDIQRRGEHHRDERAVTYVAHINQTLPSIFPPRFTILNKILCAGAAILVTASAIPQAKKWYSLDQVARFDNIAAVPGVAVSPIGIYDDIFWQGMSLTQTGGRQNIAIVVPNSPPNVAAFSALDVASVTQGQLAMAVNYADSTIDHFSLKSFYYGCSSASQASVAALPVSCTVFIKGYADDKAAQLVASQSFDLKVAVLQTNAQQLKADVNSKFKNLKRVDFFVSNNAVTAALIDTVSYTVYSDHSFA